MNPTIQLPRFEFDGVATLVNTTPPATWSPDLLFSLSFLDFFFVFLIYVFDGVFDGKNVNGDFLYCFVVSVEFWKAHTVWIVCINFGVLKSFFFGFLNRVGLVQNCTLKFKILVRPSYVTGEISSVDYTYIK